MDEQAVIEATRRWIEAIVIGLNLCPFARKTFETGTIRFCVSRALDERNLLQDLEREITTLSSAPAEQIETTLLIHPEAFADFLDYNDFLDSAEALLSALGLEGVVQIASFHPRYQFADTEVDDVTNFTNRSPYPMLHLLREASVSAVAEDAAMVEQIPQRNIETMRKLGREKIAEMLTAIERGP